RPPSSSFFPYTTLFRSDEMIVRDFNAFFSVSTLVCMHQQTMCCTRVGRRSPAEQAGNVAQFTVLRDARVWPEGGRTRLCLPPVRSEEHTSELPSLTNIV